MKSPIRFSVALLMAAFGVAAGSAARSVHAQEAQRRVELNAAIQAELQARMAVFGARANPIPPTAESIIAACVQQSQPILAAELHRLHAVCDSSPNDRKRIREASKDTVQTAATEIAKGRQGQVIDAHAPPARFADPRATVRNAVVHAANKHLSPDQVRRYQSEIAHRDEYRKQAIIENLVALYDDAVSLSAKQRAGIRESLHRHWEDRWYAAIDSVNGGNQYIPFIHINCFYPHIDERQRMEWRERYPRVGLLWQGLGFIQQGESDASSIIEAELGPSPKAGDTRVSNNSVAP
jgi:hypothetical protein